MDSVHVIYINILITLSVVIIWSLYLKFKLDKFSLVMPIISKNIKIVIFVPEENADTIRHAIGKAGAGCIACYDYCSFSTNGIASFRAPLGSKPKVGKENEITMTPEIRVETVCSIEKVKKVIQAARKVHPYKVMGYDLYLLLDLNDN
jgi:hypothetical protein